MRCHKLGQQCEGPLKAGTQSLFVEGEQGEQKRSPSVHITTSGTTAQLATSTWSSALSFFLMEAYFSRFDKSQHYTIDEEDFLETFRASRGNIGQLSDIQELISLNAMRDSVHSTRHSMILGHRIASSTPTLDSLTRIKAIPNSVEIGLARVTSLVSLSTRISEKLVLVCHSTFGGLLSVAHLTFALYVLEDSSRSGMFGDLQELEAARNLLSQAERLAESSLSEEDTNKVYICLEKLRSIERDCCFMLGVTSQCSPPPGHHSIPPIYSLTQFDVDFLLAHLPGAQGIRRRPYGQRLGRLWTESCWAWLTAVKESIYAATPHQGFQIYRNSVPIAHAHFDGELAKIHDDPRYPIRPFQGIASIVIQRVAVVESRLLCLLVGCYARLNEIDKGAATELVLAALQRLSEHCETLRTFPRPYHDPWNFYLTLSEVAVAVSRVPKRLLKIWSNSDPNGNKKMTASMLIASYSFPLAATLTARLVDARASYDDGSSQMMVVSALQNVHKSMDAITIVDRALRSLMTLKPARFLG